MLLCNVPEDTGLQKSHCFFGIVMVRCIIDSKLLGSTCSVRQLVVIVCRVCTLLAVIADVMAAAVSTVKSKAAKGSFLPC